LELSSDTLALLEIDSQTVIQPQQGELLAARASALRTPSRTTALSTQARKRLASFRELGATHMAAGDSRQAFVAWSSVLMVAGFQGEINAANTALEADAFNAHGRTYSRGVA
jgi:hypothetical protein